MSHNDDDPVIFGYSSSLNISFPGQDESGLTWGEWREMNDKEKDRAFDDFVWQLVDVYVVEDEEGE